MNVLSRDRKERSFSSFTGIALKYGSADAILSTRTSAAEYYRLTLTAREVT